MSNTEMAMPRNSYVNAGFFLSAMQAALSDSKCLEAFESDTGIRFTPSNSPIDQAIDKATGREKHFVESFARWFSDNHWGKEYTPDFELMFDFK